MSSMMAILYNSLLKVIEMTEQTPAPSPQSDHSYTPEERKSKISTLLHSKQHTKDVLKGLRNKLSTEDPGTKEFFTDVTDKQLNAFRATIGLIEYEMEYAVALGEMYRDSEMAGDIRGRESEVSNNMLDKIVDHLQLAFKNFKHITTQIRSAEEIGTVFEKDKNIISKNVSRLHDMADKSTRAVTFDKLPINLKKRREVK